MASHETPSPIRVGHRVRFMSDTGRRYGFVTACFSAPTPADPDAPTVYSVRFGNNADDIFPDSPTWTVDVHDLTRVDNLGNPVMTGDDGDFTAALVLLAQNLRTDAAALMSAGIPKTSEDRGRIQGYRGAAERIESLLDTFHRR